MVWTGLYINSFRFKVKRELRGSELWKRLVPLTGNPLVQPLPLLSGAATRDPVGADIEAIPKVLARIKDEWLDGESLNRQTATAFARMIVERMVLNAAPRVMTSHDARDVDLLIVGCETSLWIAEQFAADLGRALPKLAVQTVSANKLLAMFGTKQAETTITGFRLNTGLWDIHNAAVLVVSQSGQTFPVLHATRLLKHRLGERVFVVTGAGLSLHDGRSRQGDHTTNSAAGAASAAPAFLGRSPLDRLLQGPLNCPPPSSGEFDTKLGLAVGQKMASVYPFCARIFSNFSGWRPAEPTTVAAVAAHATLTELLLFLLHAFTVELSAQQRSDLLGMVMPRDDVRCLAEMRDASSFEVIPEIVLRSDGGCRRRNAVSDRICQCLS